jgi:hypothetical protein
MIKMLIISMLFVGCGMAPKQVKNYTITGPVQFKALVADFNTLAGISVLQWTDQAYLANSTITVEDLIDTQGVDDLGPGEIGFGQPLFEDTKVAAISRDEHVSSMQLSFDRSYIATANSAQLHNLFYHEVGHGLEMAHVQNKNAVMYPYIQDTAADYATFFAAVRNYMN